MRQLILILVVTFLACLVCWKNGSYLKHVYKELTSPQRWRRVEIVDERSLLEDLRDYSWEYLELLVVGLTACVVSFTIGWSANSIRKGYADFGDVDMLAECLGEHCALHRRIEQLEERIQELERSGHGEDPVSNIDCGGGECAVRTKGDLSETAKQAHQSDYKDSCAMTCFHEPSPCETSVLKKSTCTLETLEDMTKLTICQGDIAAESISKQNEVVLEASLVTDLEIDLCKLDRGDIRDSPGPVSESFDVVSNECLLSSGSSSQVAMSKKSPTEIEMGVKLDGNRNVVDGVVCEEINDSVSSTSTRKVIPEACKINHGDSIPTLMCARPISNQVEYGNSCSYAKTEDSTDEKAVDDSEVDGNTGTVGVVEDLESRATEVDVSPSTLTVEVGPVNVTRDLDVPFSTLAVEAVDCASPRPGSARGNVIRDRIPLDVSASTLTVEVVDCAGPRPDSARGNVTRGRIPQYQKLHKDVKTATLSNKSVRTSTTPHQHQYVDELALHRPSTASGDTLHAAAAAAGGQRKKKQKFYAHHPSNKTDAKLS